MLPLQPRYGLPRVWVPTSHSGSDRDIQVSAHLCPGHAAHSGWLHTSGLGGLVNPVQSKQGSVGILPAALSSEEGTFPCLLDISSFWNPLKGQWWCSADGAKTVKPYFCWKAQRPGLLQTSLLSNGQTQPLNNSAPVLLCCSPCLVSCRYSLPAEPHGGQAEGIGKLWLTFAIQTTDTVINHPAAEPHSHQEWRETALWEWRAKFPLLLWAVGLHQALPLPEMSLGQSVGAAQGCPGSSCTWGTQGAAAVCSWWQNPSDRLNGQPSRSVHGWFCRWAAGKDMGTLNPIGSTQSTGTAPAQKGQGTRPAQSRPHCLEE